MRHLPAHSHVRESVKHLSATPAYLEDAYGGASLFALILAPYFTKFAAIELSAASIRCIPHDAELNGLVHKVTFPPGDAAQILGSPR